MSGENNQDAPQADDTWRLQDGRALLSFQSCGSERRNEDYPFSTRDEYKITPKSVIHFSTGDRFASKRVVVCFLFLFLFFWFLYTNRDFAHFAVSATKSKLRSVSIVIYAHDIVLLALPPPRSEALAK